MASPNTSEEARPLRRFRHGADAGRQRGRHGARAQLTTLGFKGVQILTNVAGKELSDPAFAPFWAKAEELGRAGRHSPATASPKASADAVLFQQRHRQSVRDPVALHYLIFDGVLERHPS